MNKTFFRAAFAAGLLALLWVALSHLRQPLALAFTALIGGFYLMGALELRRHQQATEALAAALHKPPQTRIDQDSGQDSSADAKAQGVDAWLQQLPTALQAPVRQRLEGQRSALPGPAMAPFLAGLLVLLGMLGTLLGMVFTLHGTVAALDGSADLATMRAALTAPVQGLGLAFGTSVAGVATSAMLGLMVALCRRARAEAGRQLDALAAGPLRHLSRSHQRDAGLQALQTQTQALPGLVQQLQQLATQMAQQQQALQSQLLDGQQAFHQATEARYTALAQSVQASLQHSLSEGSRQTSALLLPLVERTLDGLASSSSALQQQVGSQVQQHLAGLGQQVQQAVAQVGGLWTEALAQHTHQGQQQSQALAAALAQFNTAVADGQQQLLSRLGEEQARHQQALSIRVSGLVDQLQQQHGRLSAEVGQQLTQVATGLHSAVASMTDTWQREQAAQAQAQQQLAADTQANLARLGQAQHEQLSALGSSQQASLASLAEGFAQRSEALAQRLAEQATQTVDLLSSRSQALVDSQQQQQAQLLSSLAQQHQALIDALGQRHHGLVDGLSGQQQALTEGLSSRHQALAEQLGQQQQALLAALAQAHSGLQASLAERDAQRQAAWAAQLAGLSEQLQQHWQAAGQHTAAQQQAICDTLAKTAEHIGRQGDEQARHTVAEIQRLLQAASEAPRAAAEVMGQLRQQLSDSLVRDNSLLDERAQILATLGSLLHTVQQAATEQRGAIDALVQASSTLLQQASSRFEAQVAQETGKLAELAGQIGGGAAEVASLGEAFGAGVAQFSEANTALVQRLQRMETALAAAISRSDEQLAYYVAQARELIDLSLLSQKQVMDDLQRQASRTPTPALSGEPA